MKTNIRRSRRNIAGPTRKSDLRQSRQDRDERLAKWARADSKGNVGEYKT